jgi:hypothetical protein
LQNELHEPCYVTKRQEWWQWHLDNLDVYRLFEGFADEARNCGHARLSAWLIVNRIRWETTVVTRGDDFKVSNDFIGFYARLYMGKDPTVRGGFFQIRPMKGEDFAAVKRRCGCA